MFLLFGILMMSLSREDQKEHPSEPHQSTSVYQSTLSQVADENQETWVEIIENSSKTIHTYVKVVSNKISSFV